jgi:SAM-dependent methyltransferase
MTYEAPQQVTDLSTCFFYHSMDIPGHGQVTGQWDLRGQFENYIGHVNCRDKRVLDVGCASGFLSFSAEQAGAREVVSFDMDDARRQHLLPFHKKDYYRNHSAWLETQTAFIQQWHNAYWLAHKAFGSKALVCHGDVYDIPAELGAFDVVIVGAVLEHLSDPIRALASIARHAAHTIAISTVVLHTEEAIAQFAGNAAEPKVDYMFWVYSLGTHRHVLKMLGFRIAHIEIHEFPALWAGEPHARTVLVAERVED